MTPRSVPLIFRILLAGCLALAASGCSIPAAQPSPIAPATMTPAAGAWQLGADVSSLPQVEASGGIFRDGGKAGDLLAILKSHGFTHIRLRIWNHPKDGWCDLAHTLAMAARVKRLGMGLLIDFHYSDGWADPGQQTKPAAWQNLHGQALQDAVYAFTRDAIAALDAQGTPPDMVQIGNEITNGMLWDDGRLYVKKAVATTKPTSSTQQSAGQNPRPASTGPTPPPAALAGAVPAAFGPAVAPARSPDSPAAAQRWHAFAALLKAARRGVIDGRPGKPPIRIMIHIDKGGGNATSRWFFDHLVQEHVDFDVIGLSYYPFWHGGLGKLSANLRDLGLRYDKDILVVETGYPSDPAGVNPKWKNPLPFPPTVDGQRQFLSSLASIVKSTPDRRGIGVYYWEPAWLPAPGANTWVYRGLFDARGNLLQSINGMTGN